MVSEPPRIFISARPMELKEDLLKCTTTELSYGLCCFISEVKRPNGEPYTPDSLFYLCLGIQQVRGAQHCPLSPRPGIAQTKPNRTPSTKSFLDFLISSATFSLPAVSVRAQSRGEHLHRSVLQQVLCRVHREAEGFSAFGHRQWWVLTPVLLRLYHSVFLPCSFFPKALLWSLTNQDACLSTVAHSLLCYRVIYSLTSCVSTGYIHSLVEEEFLWECKQLGAYSPIVLLNTLLFFCCKYFGFTTVEQHRQLSFAHVMRCTKNNLDNTRTTFLRFYPPISTEAESGGTVVCVCVSLCFSPCAVNLSRSKSVLDVFRPRDSGQEA